MLTIEKQAAPYLATLKITTQELNSIFDEHFETVKDMIEVSGFRKGHVPKDIAEQNLGFEKLYSKIIPELFLKELQKQNLDVIYSSEPLIYGQFDRSGHLQLNVEIYLTPKVKLGSLNQLIISKEQVTLLDSEITTEIENLRRNHSVLIPANEIKPLDTIVFDFSGSINGEKVAGAQASGYKMIVGNNNFIPGFEDNLIGMKQNEKKDFQIVFPENYHRKELSNKEVTFSVHIKEVLSYELISMEVLLEKENKTYDELFTSIKENLFQQKESQYKKDQTVTLLKQLVQISEVEPIPIPCILQELDIKLKQYIEKTGKTLEQIEKENPDFKTFFDNTNRSSIIENIKTTLVLQELQNTLEITITEEEINEYCLKKYSMIPEKNTTRYIVAQSQIKIQKALEKLTQFNEV